MTRGIEPLHPEDYAAQLAQRLGEPRLKADTYLLIGLWAFVLVFR